MLQLVAFAIPLARDLVRNAFQLPRGESFGPRQPGSEVVPRFDPLIDIIEPVHSPQRSVGKTPLARIEAVSKINEFCLCSRQHKHRYVAISVMWSPDQMAAVQRNAFFPETT